MIVMARVVSGVVVEIQALVAIKIDSGFVSSFVQYVTAPGVRVNPKMRTMLSFNAPPHVFTCNQAWLHKVGWRLRLARTLRLGRMTLGAPVIS